MNYPLFYDLLFMGPLAFAVISWAHPLLRTEGSLAAASPAEAWIWLPVAGITLLYTACARDLAVRWRKWLAGSLATLVCAGFFLLPAGERLESILLFRRGIIEILITLGCCILAAFCNRFRWFRAVTASVLFLTLPLSVILGEEAGRFSVCMILLYVLLVLADEAQRRQRKEGHAEPQKHLVCVAVFLLAVFILQAPFKASNDPYDWKVVKHIASAVQSRLHLLEESLFASDGWDSETPILGFSERSRFAGSLAGADKTALIVRSAAENDQQLYLAGRVFDSFDGRNWRGGDAGSRTGAARNHTQPDEHTLDTLETIGALLDIQKDIPPEDLYRSVTLDLEYRDIVTTSLFMPLKTLPVFDGTEETLVAKGAEIRYTKRKMTRKPVRMTYYRTNRLHPAFAELADGGHECTEESWRAALDACRMQEKDGYRYEDYLAYRDSIVERYLLKTRISPELDEVMEKVLAGAATDQEKLLRLEAMFDGYEYTTDPGPLPKEVSDGSDFLDHLVFETNRGYCSHFATAFVLLARANGIPARYVQGYCVKAGRTATIEVRSSDAHAWAEAYLPGCGWFVYDPTPKAHVAAGWETDTKKPQTAAVPRYDPERDPLLKEDVTEDEEEQTHFMLHWYQIVIPVLAGALLILILYLADAAIKRRRYERMGERDKCLLLCRRNLEYLRRRGFGMKQAETLAEYAARMKGAGNALPEDLLSFCAVYERLLYSEAAATEEERIRLEEESRAIRAWKRS